jgi:2',3'-cyclic-nucleotide 2'-phosphodiesterase (5'-nucleotidase family)
MARWASLIQQRRDERPVLLVDTGNFCASERSKNRDAQDRLFFEAMRLLRYDALAVGENEILYGRKRLLETAGKNRLELVSANILDKSSRESLVRPYVIKKIGGTNLIFTRVGALKIGIFSVVQPNLLYSADRLTRDYYEIEEPWIAAIRTASELRERGCDMVIALSHQVWDQSIALATKAPGIDLILSSHRVSIEPHSEMHGGALIVGPGVKMTSFTEILADWSNGGWQISTVDRGGQLLEIAEHPDFVRIEREYQETVRPRPLEEKD